MTLFLPLSNTASNIRVILLTSLARWNENQMAPLTDSVACMI